MPLVLVTALAGFALLAAACGDDARPAQSSASKPRAVLMPAGTSPVRVKGSGFHAGESVRVTVTPSAGDGITHRVRAGRGGTFVLGFPGVDACGGFEAVARGSRGSRASFQFSSGVGC
jgi:hypothetical protein